MPFCRDDAWTWQPWWDQACEQGRTNRCWESKLITGIVFWKYWNAGEVSFLGEPYWRNQEVIQGHNRHKRFQCDSWINLQILQSASLSRIACMFVVINNICTFYYEVSICWILEYGNSEDAVVMIKFRASSTWAIFGMNQGGREGERENARERERERGKLSGSVWKRKKGDMCLWHMQMPYRGLWFLCLA